MGLRATATILCAALISTWPMAGRAVSFWFVSASNTNDPMEDGGVFHPFDLIQEGLDACGDGDVVVVGAGLYRGAGNRDLDLQGKTVAIASLDGADHCVVDCEQVGRGLTISTGAVAVVVGVTIRNGSAGWGGGILVDHGMAVLDACTVESNTADVGGGICANAALGLRISNCVVRGNSAAFSGAGLYSADGDVQVAGTSFIANRGGFAAVYGMTGNLLMDACRVESNEASAVYMNYTGTAHVRDTVLRGNAGAALVTGYAWLHAERCTIEGNGFGGSFNGSISDSTVLNNASDGLAAHALYRAAGQLHIARCTVSGNGGVGIQGDVPAAVLIEDCLVVSNAGRGVTVRGAGYVVNDGFGGTTLRRSRIVGNGGGLQMMGGSVSHCEITGNIAANPGGGIRVFDTPDDTANVISNCLIAFNEAPEGGGVYLGVYASIVLDRCTLRGNVAPTGGLAQLDYSAALLFKDSVAWDNGPHPLSAMYAFARSLRADHANVEDPDDQLDSSVSGLEQDPLFASATDCRLSAASPCMDRGSTGSAYSVDLDGVPRPLDGDGDGAARLDMGAYEYAAVGADTHYVSLTGGHVSPFTNWVDAATNIQAAVDVADPGHRVVVANGRYDTGGRPMPPGTLSNRVVIDKPIDVRSLNGPAMTVIAGGGAMATQRCAYLGSGSRLSGFTLTEGQTRPVQNFDNDESGGGVWCGSFADELSNCVLRANRSGVNGGGCMGGHLVDCLIASNAAGRAGGGVYGSRVVNSVIEYNDGGFWGGGVHTGWVTNGAGVVSGVDRCIIRHNQAGSGGGVYGVGNPPSPVADALIVGSIIISNSATWGGGLCGTYYGSCRNSELAWNTASEGGGAYVYWGFTAEGCLVHHNTAAGGGGVDLPFGGRISNCTVVDNSSGVQTWYAYWPDYEVVNSVVVRNGTNFAGSGRIAWSCIWPETAGTNMVHGDPWLRDPDDGDYRLRADSPCLDLGMNEPWLAGALDLDGQPRVANAFVDLGAYEFQGDGSASDADGDGLANAAERGQWLTDPLNADTDVDGQDDGRERAAGTDPLNPASVFVLFEPVLGGSYPALTWSTVYGRGYWLQRSADPSSGVWSNVWPVPLFELDQFPEGTQSMLDLQPLPHGVYRVLVE